MILVCLGAVFVPHNVGLGVPHTHSRGRTSVRTSMHEQASTLCERWDQCGHGGVLACSRVEVLLIFEKSIYA